MSVPQHLATAMQNVALVLRRIALTVDTAPSFFTVEEATKSLG